MFKTKKEIDPPGAYRGGHKIKTSLRSFYNI